MTANRHGFRWNINECLRLQREFELLQLPLDKIAKLHGRTVHAIMLKLDSEGLANYDSIYTQYYSNQLEDLQQDLEEDDNDDNSDSDYSETDDDFDPYNLARNLLSLQRHVNNFVTKFTSRSYASSSV